MSGGQLQVISACVPERHFALFAEHEAAIVPILESLGIAGTLVLMQDWLAKARAVDDGPEDPEHANQLFHSTTLEGRSELRGSFDADATAILDAAFREAEVDDATSSSPAPVAPTSTPASPSAGPQLRSYWDGFMGCDRHHHLIHQLDLDVKLLPDGAVEISLPDGRTLVSKPRGPISPHLWDPPDRRTGGS